MPKRRTTFDPELAAEAKSIVALAFRNDPIEGISAAAIMAFDRSA
jgi:hypothetical protein